MDTDIRATIRDRYGAIARASDAACCDPATARADAAACCDPATARADAAACCDPATAPGGGEAAAGCCGAPGGGSLALGYTAEQLAALPPGADLGLGCGNPILEAALRPGEVVLDLGSGAGIDALLAARAVGPTGRVIGVDMTAAMIAKARGNAERVGATRVEFRLGEIEHLPLADASVDAIISNCVINLSPDKPQVLREAFRVLRPGGRLVVSDVLASRPLPASMRDDAALICGCIGNAASADELRGALADAGFTGVAIRPKDASRAFIAEWAPGSGAEDYVYSAIIEARKAAAPCCAGSC